MPTTTETGATRKLKAQVKTQANDIERIRSRISELVDNIHLLERELKRFKEQVADDVKMIIDKMEE